MQHSFPALATAASTLLTAGKEEWEGGGIQIRLGIYLGLWKWRIEVTSGQFLLWLWFPVSLLLFQALQVTRSQGGCSLF